MQAMHGDRPKRIRVWQRHDGVQVLDSPCRMVRTPIRMAVAMENGDSNAVHEADLRANAGKDLVVGTPNLYAGPAGCPARVD